MIVVRVGHLYRHAKTGGLYKVLLTSFNTETSQLDVVYKQVGGKGIFHQPVQRFQDPGRFFEWVGKGSRKPASQEALPSVLQMLNYY